MTHFRELEQNYKNILVRFLVQIKTLKFASEINWPLGGKINKNLNISMRNEIIDPWHLRFFIKKIHFRNLMFFEGSEVSSEGSGMNIEQVWILQQGPYSFCNVHDILCL